MARVEVLVGSERRRRWSVEQKQAIVAAAFGAGAVVRDVARQVDVTPSLIYRWRRGLRAAANGFAQVLVAPAGDGIAMPPVPAIEIEFAGNTRVRIPAEVSPALAAAVVEALAQPGRRQGDCSGVQLRRRLGTRFPRQPQG
jgi:transposase